MSRTKSGPPRRLRETTDALKELIFDRGLRPGDPLPTELELVELLDVSRSNLREAVRTLVAIDILEVRHGTGTFIGQMSLKPLVHGLVFKGVLMPGDDFATLRQVIEIRMVLDRGLAPSIVEHLKGVDALALHQLIDDMSDRAQRNETFADLDRAFHLALAEPICNELYGQLIGAFWDVHTIVGPRLGLPTARDLAETVAAHKAMLDAAVAGDLFAYHCAVDEHYAPLLRALQRSAVDTQS